LVVLADDIRSVGEAAGGEPRDVAFGAIRGGE
jgi:hypothetical protein